MSHDSLNVFCLKDGFIIFTFCAILGVLKGRTVILAVRFFYGNNLMYLNVFKRL